MSTLPSAGAFTARVKATDKCMRLALAYAKARDHYNHMSWDDPVAHSAASDRMYAARDALTAFACDLKNFPTPVVDAKYEQRLKTMVDTAFAGVAKKAKAKKAKNAKKPAVAEAPRRGPGRPKMTDAQKAAAKKERERVAAAAEKAKPKKASKKPTAKKPAAKPSAQHRGPGRPKKDAGAMAVLEQRALSKSATKKLKAAAKKPAAKPVAAKKPANKNQLAQSVPMGAAAWSKDTGVTVGASKKAPKAKTKAKTKAAAKKMSLKKAAAVAKGIAGAVSKALVKAEKQIAKGAPGLAAVARHGGISEDAAQHKAKVDKVLKADAKDRVKSTKVTAPQKAKKAKASKPKASKPSKAKATKSKSKR